MSGSEARASRAAALAYWAIPSLLCLWIYWYGLKAWFAQDDFAWLSLRTQVYSWSDFWKAMFAPMAQGTIRPWSERGFFMLFSWLFGLDALPFRIWVFLTQFANLALVASITWRITGLRLAGFLAPILWCVNSVLAVALSWTSSYNQILCGFFLLVAFRFFLRYTETGAKRDYLAQLLAFVLGFGALEINVVYPALAASYALFCAPRRLLSTAPMFAISAAYALLHRSIGSRQATGVYAMHWDSGIFQTLHTYVMWALGPSRNAILHPERDWLVPYGTLLIAAALIGFAVWKLLRGRRTAERLAPLFFLSWFLITLAPVLPLRDHLSEYYLTLPVIGLAMLGGWGLAEAARSGWAERAFALLVAGLYVASSVPVARGSTQWAFDRSQEVRRLVRGVERAHQLHPGQAILLTGVSTDLFWAGVFDRPFRLLGIPQVYLAPGAENNIQAHDELGSLADFVFPAGITAAAIDQGRATVYQVGGPALRNITQEYRKSTAAALVSRAPKRVDAGDSVFVQQLGSGWYALDQGFRWMGQKAVVQLGGPTTAGEKLYIAGFCPPQQVERGPLGLTITANGQQVGKTKLQGGQFELSWPIPTALLGTESLEVGIELERTFSAPGDQRTLGLAFGSFSVHK